MLFLTRFYLANWISEYLHPMKNCSYFIMVVVHELTQCGNSPELLSLACNFQQKHNWKPCHKALKYFTFGCRAVSTTDSTTRQHHKSLQSDAFLPLRKLRVHIYSRYLTWETKLNLFQSKPSESHTMEIRGATVWIFYSASVTPNHSVKQTLHVALMTELGYQLIKS